MSNPAKPSIREPKYGRLLDDFHVGETYCHPWEVTVDSGLLDLFAASFLDANPLYSSRRFARELGFRDRVVHPLALVNLALSFSVHDVSEQTIAHLAYIDLRFPNAAYPGDTISAASEVLGVRVSESRPDRGVVHVRTVGSNQDGQPVVAYERKALMPAGALADRAHRPLAQEQSKSHGAAELISDARRHSGPLGAPALGRGVAPQELASDIRFPNWPGRPAGLFEDFTEGDVILHGVGRTVGDTEHMQLSTLFRNTHPLHFDDMYARKHGFAGARVVMGGAGVRLDGGAGEPGYDRERLMGGKLR